MKSLAIISISLSLLFALAFWIADSVYEFHMFQKNLQFMLYQEPLSFLDSLIYNIPPHALFNRLSFFVACLLAGAVSLILGARWLSSEARYQVLSDNFPDGTLFLFDRNFRSLVAGGKAIEQMGLSDALIKGKTIKEIFPDTWPKISLHCKEAINGRESYFELEHAGRSYDVTTLPVSGMQASKGQGILVMHDCTKRKHAEKEQRKLEDQLFQAQKMESVGRLAGGVAHDYNNMLSIIIGHTELALDVTPPDTPLQNHLEKILDAGHRSAKITRQLLAFARKQTIDPEVLDLNKTVAAILKILRRLIGEDIDLLWQPGSESLSVLMDPSQLDQLLANLLVNARDAITGSGKITIETGHKTFDQDYCADHAGFIPGEFVMLSVSDNGCGMDREAQQHIFEPFFSTKERYKGTGLGLATVYGIIKQNNGFINVYSEPEQGTTFRIYLPRHMGKAEKTDRDVDGKAITGHGETVLIVEDETPILELGKTMLEQLGYTVLGATSPTKAMELAEKQTGEIHLVITDVIMPEMSGRELVDHLLKLYPDIKSLYMSGYTANVIAHHGVLEKGIHFINKPFSKQDFAAEIQHVLHGRKS